MKFEVGKSYRTRGGWRAEVEDKRQVSGVLIVLHHLSDETVERWKHWSCNGVALAEDRERPFPNGWDHPSDLTQEEWKE